MPWAPTNAVSAEKKKLQSREDYDVWERGRSLIAGSIKISTPVKERTTEPRPARNALERALEHAMAKESPVALLKPIRSPRLPDSVNPRQFIQRDTSQKSSNVPDQSTLPNTPYSAAGLSQVRKILLSPETREADSKDEKLSCLPNPKQEVWPGLKMSGHTESIARGGGWQCPGTQLDPDDEPLYDKYGFMAGLEDYIKQKEAKLLSKRETSAAQVFASKPTLASDIVCSMSSDTTPAKDDSNNQKETEPRKKSSARIFGPSWTSANVITMCRPKFIKPIEDELAQKEKDRKQEESRQKQMAELKKKKELIQEDADYEFINSEDLDEFVKIEKADATDCC